MTPGEALRPPPMGASESADAKTAVSSDGELGVIPAAQPVQRIVALGASNLTRGFQAVVSAARATWGPDIDVFAALGHGRSYGAPSTILVRTMPGILQCGLWRTLAAQPDVPTRALVTDVGNDILYGFPPEQILAWVEEVLRRLQQVTRDITLTDLPLDNIHRLGPLKFLAFRTIFFPLCRLSFADVIARAVEVNSGMARLAAAYGARMVHLKPAWYGIDPIHIRPSLWRRAWREILGAGSAAANERGAVAEDLRLWFMRPERRSILGMEQYTPQAGMRLPSGGRIWLY